MRDEKASEPKQAKGKRTNASATVRPVLSFRAQADLYEKIKSRADGSQRAVSEELESLVRLALDITEHRATEFVMRTIGTSIALAELTTGKKWNEDKSTALMAHSAACTASAMMLFPHQNALDESALSQKAAAAGEVLAQRSLSIYAGAPAEKVQEIGQDKVLDFMFADAERQVEPSALARALRAGAPATPDARLATPDELANLHDAPGLLPPSIGDRAAFDDAVAELPLVKAEKAAAAKRREEASLDVGAGSPEETGRPKRFQLKLKGGKVSAAK